MSCKLKEEPQYRAPQRNSLGIYQSHGKKHLNCHEEVLQRGFTGIQVQSSSQRQSTMEL